MSLKQLIEFTVIHLDYIKKLNEFKKTYKINVRMPNFPEIISENIIKYYIINNENRKCENANTGDLISEGNKIEVKCFSSKGPTSFGPTEKWKELYFLDAINFNNNKIIIYKCSLSNDSDEFSNIKINSTETYKQSCSKGKRPRLNFTNLKEQLKEYVKEVYNGDLESIFNKLSIKDDENKIDINKDDPDVSDESIIKEDNSKKPVIKKNNKKSSKNDIDI